MCKLEGHSWSESFNELKDKFVKTMILDLTIWPAAQALNFYFIPPPLRLMYLNVVYLAWSITLSYLKHNVSIYNTDAHDTVLYFAWLKFLRIPRMSIS